MRIGRLAIARGFPSPDSSDEPVRLAVVAPEPLPAAGESLAAAQARIDALERLTRLCEAGALTIDEFLIEKAVILGHPRSTLAAPRAESEPPISFTPATSSRPKRGRSLLSRLGWAILPLGLIGGVGLSALTQPETAASIWEEGLRLFGL